MSTIRKVVIPVLLAFLIALVLAPLTGSGRADAEPRLTTRTVTIPAAAFTAIDSNADYTKLEANLAVRSGTGTFEAPVYFEAPVVQVRKVVFYVVDGGASAVGTAVYRAQLAEDRTIQLGNAYSTGSDWTVQTVTVSDLSERRVSGAYGLVLWVNLPGTYPQGYKFLGAKVTYSY